MDPYTLYYKHDLLSKEGGQNTDLLAKPWTRIFSIYDNDQHHLQAPQVELGVAGIGRTLSF